MNQFKLFKGHQLPSLLDQLKKQIEDCDNTFDKEDKQKSIEKLEEILKYVKNIEPKK